MRVTKLFFVMLTMFLMGPLYMAAHGSDEPRQPGWMRANRGSAGIAPLPSAHPGAVIQVYAARTYSWRGNLAVHTWITTKAAGAETYEVHHVIGFRSRRGLPVVVSGPDVPDRFWYGNEPELLVDIRGEQAETLMPAVLQAVQDYPYPDSYTMWPGPNSNTFTAHVGRSVPELGLALPVTAIGKDYLPGGAVVGSVPSGTGYQFSLLGAFGVLAAAKEGIELNLLGLSAGIDFQRPAIKLPGIGRLGVKQLDES